MVGGNHAPQSPAQLDSPVPTGPEQGGTRTRWRLRNCKLVRTATSIVVTVYKIGGDAVQLKVERGAQTDELKRRLAEMWQVPADCQTLCVGTSVLKDTDYICDLPADESSQRGRHVMVVLQTSELHKKLKSDSTEIQLRSLKSFAEFGRKSANHDIEAVAEMLCSWDRCVRDTAVETLTSMSGKGNSFAIGIVAQVLDHRGARVRCAAVRALVQLSPPGHQYTVDRLIGRLHDRSYTVRCCVVQALREVMTEEDDYAMVWRCWEMHGRRFMREDQAEVEGVGNQVQYFMLFRGRARLA